MAELDIRRMDIREFRALGYLQEVNRRFLHPLGLALEVVTNAETGEERLGGVWDYRDDPEGMLFAELDGADAEKAASIDYEWEEKAKVRKERFGFMVQPALTPQAGPASSGGAAADDRPS